MKSLTAQQEDALKRRVTDRMRDELRHNHEVGRRVMPKRPTSRLDWPRPERTWSR